MNTNKIYFFNIIVMLTNHFDIVSIDPQNNLVRWSGHFSYYIDAEAEV